MSEPRFYFGKTTPIAEYYQRGAPAHQHQWGELEADSRSPKWMHRACLQPDCRATWYPYEEEPRVEVQTVTVYEPYKQVWLPGLTTNLFIGAAVAMLAFALTGEIGPFVATLLLVLTGIARVVMKPGAPSSA